MTTIINLIRDISTFEMIVAVVFVLATVYQLLLWVVFFGKYILHSNEIIPTANLPSVSVVIAIKNELSNLKEHLQKVIDQDYPDLEVIVVNDHSTDGSKSWLTSFESTTERLKILDSDKGDHGKKKAVTKGIKHVDSDWVVTTDADCYPVDSQWIRRMMQQSDQADIIIGHSPFVHQNTALNRFIRYENSYVALQYFSAALWGCPYMAVGRNFAYRKKVFLRVNGFSNHIDNLSGDDDLLLRDMKRYGKVAICTDRKTHVLSTPKASLASLINQKQRHVSTSLDYPIGTKFFLVSIFITQFTHYMLCVFLLMTSYPLLAVLGLLIRWLVITIVTGKAGKSLRGGNIWMTGWLIDFFLTFYYAFLTTRLFRKIDSWK